MLNKLYYNANEAFEDVYDAIMENYDAEMNGTKILYNVGIEIVDPLDRNITTSWRKWKPIPDVSFRSPCAPSKTSPPWPSISPVPWRKFARRFRGIR